MIRRSKLEVFADIIKVVAEEGEVRRTRVMYRANLAWKVLKDSLDFLEKKGILTSQQKDSGVFVSLTQEGYNVLRRFNDLESVFTTPMKSEGGIFTTARSPQTF
jgi:predicted transcriptional regulator